MRRERVSLVGAPIKRLRGGCIAPRDREQPVRLPVAAKEGAAGRMLPGKDGRLYKAGRGA